MHIVRFVVPMLARTARPQACPHIVRISPGSSGTLRRSRLHPRALGCSWDGAGTSRGQDRRTRRLIFRRNIQLTSFRWNIGDSPGMTKLADPEVTSTFEPGSGNG